MHRAGVDSLLNAMHALYLATLSWFPKPVCGCLTKCFTVSVLCKFCIPPIYVHVQLQIATYLVPTCTVKYLRSVLCLPIDSLHHVFLAYLAAVLILA